MGGLFIDDLDGSEVHIRDRWQLELKSEFFPQPNLDHSKYIQEFYFFIPNTLQINSFTYTKNQFYIDQTNLIRYKTPEFTFEELLSETNSRSPLTRLRDLSQANNIKTQKNTFSDELKLFGNVVRSAIREEVKNLINELSTTTQEESKALVNQVQQLCTHITRVREAYSSIHKDFLTHCDDQILCDEFLYVDEFLSRTIVYYLTGLLENIRLIHHDFLIESEKVLCDLILKEQEIANFYLHSDKYSMDRISFSENEQVLYRDSLLDKFVRDALLLHTNRFTIEQKYQHWIAGFAAGIAMLIYFSLFIWLGKVFVWNSLPFILFTVVIYVLKDRIKDWIKTLSYTHAFKWFSDFGTVIQSPDENHNVGIIRETFSFIDESKVIPEIKKARNVGFHEVLSNFQRPENVMFYKRTVEINNLKGRQSRRYGLNIIFRFNIHRFLRKAANPTEIFYNLNQENLELKSLKLPKVYHLDLIIRNITKKEEAIDEVEIKKLRIIIDKNGIKRIEQLN